MIQIVGRIRPNIFTIWSFVEKVCCLRVLSVHMGKKDHVGDSLWIRPEGGGQSTSTYIPLVGIHWYALTQLLGKLVNECVPRRKAVISHLATVLSAIIHLFILLVELLG